MRSPRRLIPEVENSADMSREDVSRAPLLTIVSVVKDDEAGLSETWQSVERQSFSDYEFLIVTPGNQKQLFAHLLGSSRKIRLCVDPGEGIYTAMNLGLVHARGDYVIFLNAGDVLVDSPLVLQMAMDEMVGRECSWLAFSYRILDGNKSKTHIKEGELVLWSFAFGFERVLHQALIMRHSWINRLGGFNTRYEIAGDYDLVLRALSECNLPTSSLVLSEFRTGGVSSRNPNAVRREISKSQRDNLPASVQWRVAQTLWNGYWMSRLWISGNQLCSRKRSDQTRRW